MKNIKRLVKNLFQTYRLGNSDTRLNIDLEEDIFFDMDTAVPLGIIINELVSNSLKYAFPGKDKGIIQIKLCKEESGECTNNIPENEKVGCENTNFILTVSDNGVGIPEGFNSESSASLGLQLVSILADQLGGKLELKRDSGTGFIIRFTVAEKNMN
jgi:two-component sensor histidine kinase